MICAVAKRTSRSRQGPRACAGRWSGQDTQSQRRALVSERARPSSDIGEAIRKPSQRPGVAHSALIEDEGFEISGKIEATK
jgi:hypothetical protein